MCHPWYIRGARPSVGGTGRLTRTAAFGRRRPRRRREADGRGRRRGRADRMRASVTLTPSWTDTAPAALCTTKYNSAPSSSSSASAPGGAPAWASSTQAGAPLGHWPRSWRRAPSILVVHNNGRGVGPARRECHRGSYPNYTPHAFAHDRRLHDVAEDVVARRLRFRGRSPRRGPGTPDIPWVAHPKRVAAGPPPDSTWWCCGEKVAVTILPGPVARRDG